jgi:hypothetical protein
MQRRPATTDQRTAAQESNGHAGRTQYTGFEPTERTQPHENQNSYGLCLTMASLQAQNTLKTTTIDRYYTFVKQFLIAGAEAMPADNTSSG